MGVEDLFLGELESRDARILCKSVCKVDLGARRAWNVVLRRSVCSVPYCTVLYCTYRVLVECNLRWRLSFDLAEAEQQPETLAGTGARPCTGNKTHTTIMET